MHRAGVTGSICSPGGLRRQRACFECARARERCTRESPCSRCNAKSLHCRYPREDATSSTKIREESVGAWHGQVSIDFAGETADNVVAQQHLEPHVPIEYPSDASHCLVPPQADAIVTHELQQPFKNFDYDYQIPSSDDMGLSINWLPPSLSLELQHDFMFRPSMQRGTYTEDAIEHCSIERQNEAAAVSPLNSSPSNSEPQPQPTLDHLPSVGDVATFHPLEASPNASSSFSSASSSSFLPSNGHLYATSVDGARNPCTMRPNTLDNPVLMTYYGPLSSIADDDKNQLESFEMPLVQEWPHGVDAPEQRLDVSTYQTMRIYWTRYASAAFPPAKVLDFFIGLYFRHFDSTFPIIHGSSFDINDCWILTSAVAAIGAQYSQTRQLTDCAAPLHKFVCQVLQDELDNGDLVLAKIQAVVLNLVGLTYCGPKRLQTMALNRRSVAWSLLRSIAPTQISLLSDDNVQEHSDTEYRWKHWSRGETWRRLRHAMRVCDKSATFLIFFILTIDHRCSIV